MNEYVAHRFSWVGTIFARTPKCPHDDNKHMDSAHVQPLGDAQRPHHGQVEQPAVQSPQYGHLEPVYASNAFYASVTTPRLPDRPARTQVEQVRKLQTAEHLGDYNIWYGKYMGDSRFERAARASTRVCLETDAGLTRADYTSATAHICLHFARGCCTQGKLCTFRHNAPTEEDESQSDAPHDIFGRNRHGSFRDDMGGTGTWNKECKTIYVGRICSTPSEPEMTETLARHFAEFGPIESVRVLKNKGCGFVTYRLRCTAEFAKEAMAEQALDNDDQINVRWAYDDPNPKAQAVRLRNSAQIMLAAMEAKGHLPSTSTDGFYPDADSLNPQHHDGDPDAEASGSEAKRQRTGAPMTREEHEQQLAEAEAALAAAAAAEAAEAEAAARRTEHEVAVNNANRLDALLSSIDGRGGAGQCIASEGASQRGGGGAAPTEGPAGRGGAASAAVASDPLNDFLRAVEHEGAQSTSQVMAAGSHDDSVELPPGVRQPGGLPPGWQTFTDPSSGHPYFVSPSGQSTWRRPA